MKEEGRRKKFQRPDKIRDSQALAPPGNTGQPKPVITWSKEAGARYQLQYTSDLSSSNWTSLGSSVTATGATLSTTDSLTNAPQRFYRLALSP
jgi:hypothetical protein